MGIENVMVRATAECVVCGMNLILGFESEGDAATWVFMNPRNYCPKCNMEEITESKIELPVVPDGVSEASLKACAELGEKTTEMMEFYQKTVLDRLPGTQLVGVGGVEIV